ncbi:hypothetical protein [Legionella israelensis]|uniref:hypothetical protein n=1 Tax=Legionella israelensis TaxID=454 RepID=UPI0014319F5B|nr:hypothetical protein [Legionella israelensis]
MVVRKNIKRVKLDAIRLVLEQNYTRAEAARSLSIHLPGLSDSKGLKASGKLAPCSAIYMEFIPFLEIISEVIVFLLNG